MRGFIFSRPRTCVSPIQPYAWCDPGLGVRGIWVHKHHGFSFPLCNKKVSTGLAAIFQYFNARRYFFVLGLICLYAK
jgi:hypothetical protein